MEEWQILPQHLPTSQNNRLPKHDSDQRVTNQPTSKMNTPAQHTPAPWRIEMPMTADTSLCSKAGCQIAIQGPTGPDICWIRSFSEWQDTAKANAALICAAPDLLEVLEIILEEDGARLKNDTWRKLRAVIAKAKQLTRQP